MVSGPRLGKFFDQGDNRRRIGEQSILQIENLVLNSFCLLTVLDRVVSSVLDVRCWMFGVGCSTHLFAYPQRTSSNFSNCRTRKSRMRPMKPIMTMPATTRS